MAGEVWSPSEPVLTPADFAHMWQGVTTTERASPRPKDEGNDDAAAPQAGGAGSTPGSFGSRRGASAR